MSKVEILVCMNYPSLHHKQFHSCCSISCRLLKSHLMSVSDLIILIKAEKTQSLVCSCSEL